MQNIHRGGRLFRVYGANRLTGEDVELIVDAYDEADASRAANRKDVFVSRCVAVAAAGTFARAMSDDATVQKLLARFPDIGYRLSRLNAEDQDYLIDLGTHHTGVEPKPRCTWRI